MSPPPFVTLEPASKVGTLLQTLKCYPWEDFPVTDPNRGGALVGVIMRLDVLILLQHKGLIFFEGDSSPPVALKYEHLMNRHRDPPTLAVVAESLTEEDQERLIDLTPYVQIAHNTFDRHGLSSSGRLVFAICL